MTKGSLVVSTVLFVLPGMARGAFVPEDERALADRLLMHWNTHATDVFVRDGAVVGVGGRDAGVPTVMFGGQRTHVTAYRRPKLEDLPRRFEDPRGLLLESGDGGGKTWAPYGKTGSIIVSVNREIMAKARDAARKWTKDGDEFSARLAFNVLDTYLTGLLARNVPTDLDHGHLQTLFGLQSMETIHDDIISETCETYALLKPWIAEHAADRIPTLQAALKKWAEVQIDNGVADNNWDMMQLNYILSLALTMDDPADRAHYVDVVLNQSSVRNLSVKALAEKGFDPQTGIWWECPGYSVNVTLKDFAKFVVRARSDLGIDLLKEIPVLQTAFDAANEYLFPDGYQIGFGDTHPGAVAKEVVALQQHPHCSPFFHAPNASWLVARSGMDRTNDVAFALNASLGNHMHANGINLELYAKGYRLAPDAGIGWALYSGDDYKEYYSQFPAHNTVMVNSRSTYQVMKSYHPFTLEAHGDNWATVRFREPCTGADQQRTVRYVKDEDGAYFVDVFRSRLPQRATPSHFPQLPQPPHPSQPPPSPEWHDYYYHNLGDSLTLNGPVKPTELIAFVESGLYALSYIKEKFAREGSGDCLATFDWARPEGNVRMRVFMNGAEGRTFIQAMAPATEGLSRIKDPNYNITRDSRTPVLVVRQEDEAWTRPFLAVMDPSGTVASVDFAAQKILVHRTNGKTDTIDL